MFSVLLLLTNTSFAKYADEYEKKYPDNVNTMVDEYSETKDTIKYYTVYSDLDFMVTVFLEKRMGNSCYVLYTYNGTEPKNYTEIRYSDGKKKYTVKLDEEPVSIKSKKSYIESYFIPVDTRTLKEAVYIAAVTKDNKMDFILRASRPKYKEFMRGIEEAYKILYE